MAEDDRTLADRVEGGDEAAFRTLYRRHTPYLLHFSMRILGGSEADAEDVVQETWIRAVDALGGFRWESTLRTWLGGIALNRARDRLRRAGRRVEQEVDVEASRRAATPAKVADRVDLERAIDRLPDGYRTVLVLHDIEGLTHEEIGDRLGIAAVTSRSQLSRARGQLRAMLEPVTATG